MIEINTVCFGEDVPDVRTKMGERAKARSFVLRYWYWGARIA